MNANPMTVAGSGSVSGGSSGGGGKHHQFVPKAWIKLTLLDANDDGMRKQRKDGSTDRTNKIKILNVLVATC